MTVERQAAYCRPAVASWYGASLTFTLIKLVNFNVLRPAAGQLLVPERIGVQLCLRNLLGLCAVAGLKIDNRRLARVDAADQIDPPIHRYAIFQRDFDLFF
jgi:hypothetical protein